jgi:hypothetical protein
MQGIGASLSSTVGGVVAECFGYGAAFFVLGGIGAVALALWVGTRAITAEVCGDTPATAVPRGVR